MWHRVDGQFDKNTIIYRTLFSLYHITQKYHRTYEIIYGTMYYLYSMTSLKTDVQHIFMDFI